MSIYRPSPLMPFGEKSARKKTPVFFKIMLTLTIHVVIIGGMLLQGCKDTRDTAPALPPLDGPVATTPKIETLPVVTTTPAPASVAPVVQKPVALQPAPAVAPVAPAVVVYKVQQGDTLSKIAKRNHTTFKKLMSLNHLKSATVHSGQVLKVPAPSPAGSSSPETAAN